MAFAERTEVPIAKTKGEIDGLLRKHRATGFGTFEEADRALIVFQMKDRRIRFDLPLPKASDRRFTVAPNHRQRSAGAATAAWEQACRSRWRALFLCIKAKLESIESGIETFDDAFLAHIQMPDGRTVGEHVKPNVAIAYQGGDMKNLLPSPAHTKEEGS